MRRSVLDRALADAAADAFVHVGPADDPTIRSFSGVSLSSRAAVVYDGDTRILPARRLPNENELRDDVTVLDPADTPARRLPALVAGDAVLAPRTIPHDAALYLDDADITLTSTDAHLRARERKTPAEREAIRAAQDAAEAGMVAAAALLANARGDPLEDDRGPITAERVRRTANAAIAEAGAEPAGNTELGASGELSPDETVPIRLAPRRDGYHGLLARTFVADSGGGWERRATLACEYAVDAAMDIVEVGDTTAAAAASEATAELGSYGFPPTAGSATVHGVGLEPRELPAGDGPIEADVVLGVSTELDADDTVWVADLGVVTEDGVERVGTFPRSVVPKTEY
jgi:Xaa-Pro aminopeptidase